MIATFPHDRFRGLPEFLLGIAVLLTGFLIASGRLRPRIHPVPSAESASALITARPDLVSQLESTASNRELEILRAINHKYSDAATDGDKASVSNALAEVTAQRFELELMVSKQLDLARHRQEVSLRNDPTRPRVPRQHLDTTRRLSVLPR